MAAGGGLGSVTTQMSSSHNSLCQDICTLPLCSLSESPLSLFCSALQSTGHIASALWGQAYRIPTPVLLSAGDPRCTSASRITEVQAMHSSLILADGTAQPLVMQCLLPITGECSPYGGQISAWRWGGEELSSAAAGTAGSSRCSGEVRT